PAHRGVRPRDRPPTIPRAARGWPFPRAVAAGARCRLSVPAATTQRRQGEGPSSAQLPTFHVQLHRRQGRQATVIGGAIDRDILVAVGSVHVEYLCVAVLNADLQLIGCLAIDLLCTVHIAIPEYVRQRLANAESIQLERLQLQGVGTAAAAT